MCSVSLSLCWCLFAWKQMDPTCERPKINPINKCLVGFKTWILCLIWHTILEKGYLLHYHHFMLFFLHFSYRVLNITDKLGFVTWESILFLSMDPLRSRTKAEVTSHANDRTGSAESATMRTQQVCAAHAGKLAHAISKEGLNSNGLNVASIQPATLSPRTAAHSYICTTFLHSQWLAWGRWMSN